MKNTPYANDPAVNKMLLVANLYYREKLSQQEISTRLNISRPWVSKLLSRAEAEGIVRIEIISPYQCDTELCQALCQKYGLKHAKVICNDSSADGVASAAADYFLYELQENDTVAVGWGTGVSQLISHIRPTSYPGVKVVPMAGSFGNASDYVPNVSALRLAEKLGTQAQILHTPARCSSSEEYETLRSIQNTVQIIQQAECAEVLLLGIGLLEDSIQPHYGIFDEYDVGELRAQDAMGDIALQYLNHDGKPIDTNATKRLIKADIIKASQNARTIIGIAFGLRKAKIIHAALQQKLANVLFTDEKTALSLLSI